MAGLTVAQRDAIVRRCAGLVATYFASASLRAAAVELQPRQLKRSDLEFHDYLRLAIVLPAGARLCVDLGKIALAPAIEQEMTVRIERGQLSGPIDPAAHSRRVGQRSNPRLFPVRRLSVHHLTAENIVAASAALALLGELQQLVGRTRLPGSSSEGRLATQVLDALQGALASSPLAGLTGQAVDLSSEAMAGLLTQVDERWRGRRISNRAYTDIARWVAAYRHRRLRPEGLLESIAYGEEFDNRLFEIFVLFCVRTGLEQLGFACTEARPLHLAPPQPVMEFSHPDGSASLDVFFQRADGVVWTPSCPREWPDIMGIPDLIISARSAINPVVLIDAKNRERGDAASTDGVEDEPRVGRHATSEELHKMLGYFANFSRRTRVGKRGPVGGLIFRARSGSTDTWLAKSDKGGLLGTVAIDPLDEQIAAPTGPARRFMEPLLRAAGLFGGERPDGWQADADLQALHATLPDEQSEAAQAEREAAIHAWTRANYGSDSTRVATTEALLERHVLGEPWHQLTEEEHRFLATAEIFWEDHAGTVGMDFGPVIIEIAKTFESLAGRRLIEPFRAWADANGREVGQVATIGDVRAELERVSRLQRESSRPRGARSLADYLETSGQRQVAIDVLLPVLSRLNVVRREAAHPHSVTNRVAAECRSWTLGIGAEACALSLLASTL